jgi:hypothetical protein
MSGIERRLDRTDVRISDLERDVIEVRAEQRGAEKVMNAEHRLLHDKIDGIARGQQSIDARLDEHLEEEERDRKANISSQRGMLVKLSTMIIGGFAIVVWFLVQKATG